ncbi:multiple cyclophane-containing RiPP AmcA [Actinospica robiniae]|jgi:hypothetical protein|uniref:multiple cyclophane-containing RiPP AmcA n=1 Tax=Actinospica robiniae TaxID=304901 RepID=UPI00041D9A04|nr:multiple cyclophane-containing RiPP AmcA [Actinospica robiniae]
MTILQELAASDAPQLLQLIADGATDAPAPIMAGFDNRPTWDNKGGSFDNRPSWDNWSKK